jgi:hypothetical protein
VIPLVPHNRVLTLAFLALLVGLTLVLLVDIVGAQSVWNADRFDDSQWWQFSKPMTPGDSFVRALEQLPQNPSWFDDYVGIAIGLAAREAVGDMQVGRVIAPAPDMSVLVVKDEDGNPVTPIPGYVGYLTGNTVEYVEYEPIVPTETIQRWWDEGRMKTVAWDVHYVEVDEPGNAVVLHRDWTGANIFVVPLSESPYGGGS